MNDMAFSSMGKTTDETADISSSSRSSCSISGSVTLSRPEAVRPLVRRDGEPVFDEPWQAQVMALAFTLMEQGAFTNALWSDTLGAELEAASARGEPDTSDTYYRCALGALESLLAGSYAIPAPTLDERTERWRQAYLDTPHGQPVELPTTKS